VDSDECPFSTGWECNSEDKDGVHGAKVNNSKKQVQSFAQLPIKRL